MGAIRGFFFVTALCLASSVAKAAPCDKLPAWLSVSEVTFRVVEATDTHDVKVTLPKIADLKCTSLPFEYGTDYTFDLPKSSPVKMEYFKKGSATASRTVEMGDSLTAHSVLVASDRKKTPHYFEIHDEELEVDYQIYLTPDKGPSHAKRSDKKNSLKIVSYK
jgi:hypothetical protein